MKENSFLWMMYWYIKGNVKAIVMNCAFVMVFVAVFYLYSVELEAAAYGFFLSFCIAFIFIVQDFIKFYKKHNDLRNLEKQIIAGTQSMPYASNLIEADYQRVLTTLYDQNLDLMSKIDIRQTEMMDYYTLWAHQIKTPIAAIRLLLQQDENVQNKELSAQVFKIEEYVDMVLGYLKIDNSSSDLVIQNHDLSELVRQAIRKYAKMFIRKNISLEFKEMDHIILTDEKWLVFVIEQILSNALKYTNKGKISIYMEDTEERILVIEDTGIGIAKEDLPRVFERGFTGYNGRMDKKATGIGLYLCKKILDKLSHRISISSQVGLGTKVKINLTKL